MWVLGRTLGLLEEEPVVIFATEPSQCLLPLKKKSLLFFSVLCVCIFVLCSCGTCVSPGTRFLSYHGGCWDLNPCSMEEQLVLS